MKKSIFLFLFVAFITNSVVAQNVREVLHDGYFYEPARHVFWVGESIIIPFACDNCTVNSSAYVANSTDEQNNTILFNLEQNQHLTKEQEELYCNNDKDCINNHWQNKQAPWKEFVAKAEKPGKYKFSLNLKSIFSLQDENSTIIENVEKNNTIDFDFTVFAVTKNKDENIDLSSIPLPNSFATILSHDTAASYEQQKEIYSKLKNNTLDDVLLHRPYMDYYLTKEYSYVVFSVWMLPNEGCVEVLKCDESHYVIRQRYNQESVRIFAGAELDEFQIGLWEALKNGYDNTIKALPEKRAVSTSYSVYYDDSYLWPTNNTTPKEGSLAAMRNSFYNYKMASYDENGTLLYGNPPSWFGSQCKVATVGTWNVNGDAPDGVVFKGENRDVLCKENNISIPSKITIEYEKDKDVIYEGEDYFAMPIVKSTEGKIKSLKIIDQSDFDWLETGEPADYWANNYPSPNNNYLDVSQYKYYYVRSINRAVRQNHNIPKGSYTYTLLAEDDKGNQATTTRTIEILDGSKHPAVKNNSPTGLAVLVGDETWFKNYQLDIASGIERYDDQNEHIIKKCYHYDYFGEISGSVTTQKSKFHNWYSDDGITQTLYDCGDGKYRIKYEFTGNPQWHINFNQSLFDVKTGFVNTSNGLSEIIKKNDYSMQPFVENGVLKLYSRKYNPNVPLYDDQGNLLWGTPPKWRNSCKKIGVLPFNGNSEGNDCKEDVNDNPIIINEESNVYNSLTVQFQDKSDNNYNGDFNFQIANASNQNFSIGGYEMRFYYTDGESFDASMVKIDDRVDPNATISNVQCADGQYALKIKLSENATVNAQSFFPHSNPIGISVWMDNGKELPKSNPSLYSWIDVSAMSNNPQMGLFDSKGHLIYGESRYPCDDELIHKRPKFSIYEIEQLSQYSYDDNELKKNINISNGINYITLDVRNEGLVDEEGPIYVNYYITHPIGQIPLFESNGVAVSTPNTVFRLMEDLSVYWTTEGNKHTYHFILKNGLESQKNRNINFSLRDKCIDCVHKDEAETFFSWNLDDDWSADPEAKNKYVKTDRVVILSKNNEILYGHKDPDAPVYNDGKGGIVKIEIPDIEVEKQLTNRTDAVAYSGGQLLLNGNFEESSLTGWTLDRGNASSIRGDAVQGTRFVKLNGQISQVLPTSTLQLLLDSGAVLSFWHRCATQNTSKSIHLYVPSSIYGHGSPVLDNFCFNCSETWKKDSISLKKERFTTNAGTVNDNFSINFASINDVELDDIALVPGNRLQPTTYAIRFTTTQHEEVETRAYDGENSLVVTTSERDLMGRPKYKYLPFELKCANTQDCNSDAKTQKYPDMAKVYYDGLNTSYPDAGGYPYTETQWKPDPAATKDVEGAPGIAFSITSGHVARAYSSGVNLSDIDTLDFRQLNSAVKAVYNERTYSDEYGNKANYHAAKDAEPTHIWELLIDPNGNAAFTVKDGDGHVVISGGMQKTGEAVNGQVVYEIATRSISKLDARGNVVVSHSPMSCAFKPKPANCVAPDSFVYDTQSRVIKTFEPDAGESRTYYDIAGRVRATQTQRQIDSGACSVVGYDHLDRMIFTGEWKCGMDEASLREKFMRASSVDSPFVDELTPGTVTRTFYDRIPSIDTLGVNLYPQWIVAAPTYTRGRIAAVISDVRAVVNNNGDTLKTSDGKDSVIRVSSTNSYDKYGHILASYTYDPTLPDSLKQLWTITQYDLSGKVLSTTKYPYGYSFSSAINRNIKENYVYDRLGRVSKILSSYANTPETELARYEYYPTGSVKTVTLGNSLTLSYTYHISGAIKTATVMSADNRELYADTLYYEDCGGNDCKPQYNGNISRMAHHLAHGNSNYGEFRDVLYTYDELNRLIKVDDKKQDVFDEMFAYDAQGRITAQRRGDKTKENAGGEYSYYSKQNRLKSVTQGVGGTADSRNMEADSNFVYDSEGNLVEDKSKRLKIFYDWRGMPIEFIQQQQPTGSSSDTLFKLTMAYDGSGRRISKTSMRKVAGAADWDTTQVTHYTGIGTEVRENYAGPAKETKVVVNMPNGLGRYGVEDAESPDMGFGAGYIPNVKFEWFLKNHLGSTMLVYGTQANASGGKIMDKLDPLAAYDYRAFGEQVNLVSNNNGVDKVTETFTGKEFDDEIALDYFGARYLDPMLGLWSSVDPKRQFASPYLYAGNGVNPVNVVDSDGNEVSLSVDENRTITDMQYKDNGIDRATVAFADGSTMEFVEPPKGSYFWSKNDEKFEIIGKQFDCTMEAKANAMIEQVDAFAIGSWGSGGDYDFKYRYYSKFGNNSAQRDALTFTVGSLNGTIMTARDVGNALWGGYTRNTYLNKMYPLNPLAQLYAMNLISEAYSLKSKGAIEDYSSLRMQNWGFRNYKP